VENSPECPSSDALRDLQAAVEKVLLSPGDGLESILILAVAYGPDGNVESRTIVAPSERQQRLLEMLRDYLAVPIPERTAGAL
jgi:hypothetical protein